MTTVATHNSNFHADDAFAVATLSLIFPDVKVIRTRDEETIKNADVAVDVGGIYDPTKLRFDHHQTGGAGIHENGIPYASFGLVWKEYGEKLSGSKEVAEVIEKKLVCYVDALDNGVNVSTNIYEDIRPYTISDYLYSYWIDGDVDKEHVDQIFHRVSSMAKDLIIREIDKAKRIFEETKLVEDIYNESLDKRMIVLEKNLAWGKVFEDKPEALVVIYPNKEVNTWSAKMIRVNSHSFETRISFPKAWAGLTGENLVKVSGVSDAVFCHNARFLTVAQSKEGAIKLAQIALNA